MKIKITCLAFLISSGAVAGVPVNIANPSVSIINDTDKTLTIDMEYEMPDIKSTSTMEFVLVPGYCQTNEMINSPPFVVKSFIVNNKSDYACDGIQVGAKFERFIISFAKDGRCSAIIPSHVLDKFKISCG